MVRKRGFEPLRYCYRQPLKLVRLPFRHFRVESFEVLQLPTVANNAGNLGAMQNDQYMAAGLTGTTDSEHPDGRPEPARKTSRNVERRIAVSSTEWLYETVGMSNIPRTRRSKSTGKNGLPSTWTPRSTPACAVTLSA